MEIRKEQTAAPQREHAAEDLRLINALAKSALTEEQVYTFAVKLCDNEVDRDYERFDKASLETLRELFVGRSGMFDHQWSAAGQTARIYKTELCEEAGLRTAAGESYCYLKGYAYMLRNEKNAALIEEIEGGIKKEVSVGCSVKKCVCSICGKELGGSECPHRKGEEYGGRVCCRILQEPTDAYEWSFVAVPAQREAGVMKKRFGAQGCDTLQKFVEAAGEARFTAELRELDKLACLGQKYMEELRGEVLRMALLAERDLDGETFRGITEKLGESELRELRKLYRRRAEARYPVEPQLTRAAGADGEKTDEDAFLI